MKLFAANLVLLAFGSSGSREFTAALLGALEGPEHDSQPEPSSQSKLSAKG